MVTTRKRGRPRKAPHERTKMKTFNVTFQASAGFFREELTVVGETLRAVVAKIGGRVINSSPGWAYITGTNRRQSADGLPLSAEVTWDQRPAPVAFNEADCGGVFDGFSVTSDADPGL